MKEQPAFSKVLTESYLTGAALGLPVKLFSSVFLDTRSVRLRNAAGHEWSGKVSVRDDRGQRSATRIEVTSGWGVFAKANGLQAGDEVRVQYKPEDVLLVTVVDPAATASGTTARAATPAASQRGAQHSSSDGLAALTATAAGQVAEQKPAGQQTRSGPEVEAAAEQRQQEQQVQQQVQEQVQQQVQQQVQEQVQQQVQEQVQPEEGRQRPSKRQRSDPVALAAVAAAAAAAACDAANAAAVAALVAANAAEQAAAAAAAAAAALGQG